MSESLTFDPLSYFDDDWAEEFEDKVNAAGFSTLTQTKVLDMIDAFTDRETNRDPETFAREVLGHDPWHVPLEIMKALDVPFASVAVKACHASAKTFTAAEIALYYVCERQALVITTAPTDAQVKRLLWGEMKKFHANAREPLGGHMLDKELRYSSHNYAVGFSTDQAVRFSGYHGDLVVIIVDEAPGLREEIYDAIEGVRAGGDVRLLLIGNPVISGGTFEAAFKQDRSFWTTFTIDGYDTPNLMDLDLHDPVKLDWFVNLDPNTDEGRDVLGYAPRPYLITRDWVYKRYHEWGPDDPRFVSRVRGGFPPFDEYSLFNLSWLEAAKVRKAALKENELQDAIDRARGRNPIPVVKQEDNFEGGLDIAGDGSDETVLVIREGPKIHGIWTWSKGETVGEVIQICRKYMTLAAIRSKKFRLKYDVAGDGFHYGTMLKDARIPVTAIHAQHTPLEPERFRTLKDEMYFHFRDLLRDGYVCELHDEELIGQAAPIKWGVDSKGRNFVESKEKLRDRGFRSPDRLEAAVYAFAKVNVLAKGKSKRIFAGKRLAR
jgi:phage terminase large subunit